MSWYALRVKSRHEKQVGLMLEFKSLSSFTPLYNACHEWADRKKIVHLPLFPGYVFCEFGASQKALVLQTPGVIDVVAFGHTPAPIDDAEIHALQILVASGCNAEPLPTVIIGRPAAIIAGPLTGLTGVVVQHKTGLRLVLSVTLLRRSVLVEVDRSQVMELTPLPVGRATDSCTDRHDFCYRAHSA